MMQDFYSIDNYPFDSKIGEENLIKFINTKELGKIWLIYLDERMVGYVVLTFGFSFEYKGQDAFIDELFVKTEYLNQGIGNITMEYLKEQAKEIGINTIHLEVEKHNKKGSKLYINNGFRTSDRILMTYVLNE